MKKLIALILALSLIAIPFSAFAVTPDPKLTAEGAILVDVTTGKVLFEKNADEILYPASTTKMITGLLALEILDPDEIITADEATAKTGGTKYGMKVGDKIRAEDLINIMLVMSANDLATCVADYISGNVEDFAILMNDRAMRCGATNTHFANANGLHNDDHYSTARDLALIALECMKNEDFARIVSQSVYRAPAIGNNPAMDIKSTNLMLYGDSTADLVYVNGEKRTCKYEGCFGIKTGYTGQAGECLVAGAERNGTRLISVVLKSSGNGLGRFADSIALLDWGFENYKTIKSMDLGTVVSTIKVNRGAVKTVDVIIDSDAVATVPSEASAAVLSTKPDVPLSVDAPVEEGQVIGKVILSENGIKVAEYDAVAAETVEKGGILSIFGIDDATAAKIFKAIKLILIAFVIVVVILIVVARRKAMLKKKKRQAEIAKRKAEEQARKEEWLREYERKKYNK